MVKRLRITPGMFLKPALMGGFFVLSFSNTSLAQEQPGRDSPYSLNDFGGIGLIEMRTARFGNDGDFTVGGSFVNPYRRYTLTWQILPFMEVAFRYTDITNSPEIGAPTPQSESEFFSDLFNFNSGGTDLDRGFDLKFKLLSETDNLPQVALGLQDFAGTGAFSGEYIVASKRINRFDFTLGMGWGYFAQRETFSNPFKILGSTFDERTGDRITGGTFSIGDYFSGDKAALFGGVEYFTPIEGLSLKAEWSSIDHDEERFTRLIGEDLPINFAVNYRPVDFWEISLGFERGNSIMFRTALRANFYSTGLSKADRPLPNVRPRDERPVANMEFTIDERSTGIALDALYDALAADGLEILAFHNEPLSADIVLRKQKENLQVPPLPLSRLVFSVLPRSVRMLNVQVMENDGNGIRSYVIHRAALALNAAFPQVFPPGAGDAAALEIREDALYIAGGSGESPESLAPLLEPLQNIREIYSGTPSDSRRLGSRYDILAAARTEELFALLGEQEITAMAVHAHGETLEIVTPGESPDIGGEIVRRLADVTGAHTVAIDTVPHDEPSELSLDEISRAIFNDLPRYGLGGYAVDIRGDEGIVYLAAAPFRHVPRNLGIAARVAANWLPDHVEKITIVELIGGLETSRITVLRSDFEAYEDHRSTAAEMFLHADFPQTRRGAVDARKGTVNEAVYPSYNWALKPQLLQHVGDPTEGIYKADLNAGLDIDASLSPHLHFSFSARQRLFGNLDDLADRGSGSPLLPRVRSNIVNYLQEGQTAIDRLQVHYIRTLAPEVHFRATAGLMEMMYGGVGAELLYAPTMQNWAVGVDINWVKQRDFEGLFGFRDFETVTGHASLYYDLPFYDMRLKVDAGRYLARDWGATIDISREFKSGVRVGAFATLTDVPFDVFGEGSFDKGFYITFPIDLLLTRTTRQRHVFAFRPLTKDGGQQLNVGPELFGLIDEGNSRNTLEFWNLINAE